VHVGRVNCWKRYKAYADLGADTCDGSGIAKYDYMMRDIEKYLAQAQESKNQKELFA